MPVLLTYLLKLSISLAVVYLFYRLVLNKLTCYNCNRWYLAGYSLLCFLIPFINISVVLQKHDLATNLSWVPIVETASAPLPAAFNNSNDFFTGWNMILFIICGGVLVLLVKLFIQFISYNKMKRNATVIEMNGLHIYQVDSPIIPFSFGNSIFINRNLHDEKELQDIIQHEFIHVKQKHSLDIIWSEVLCIINWYNPFAWLIKKAIRQNLEFIADNKVVETGISKKEYQYLLLKVIGNNQYSIATPFNYSSLKKRIAMMNKLKSTKRQMLRMLFLLPATALLLLAFRNGITEPFYTAAAVSTALNPNATLIDEAKTLPGHEQHPADTVPERLSLLPTKVKAFETVADDLKDILINKYTITILFRDGRKETYDTEIASDREAYEKKYGKLAGSTVQKHLSPSATEKIILVDIDNTIKGIPETALTKSPVNTIALTQPVTVADQPLNLIATTQALTVTGHPLKEVNGTRPVAAAINPLRVVKEEPVTVTGYPLKKLAQLSEKTDILTVGGLSLVNEGQYILIDGKEHKAADKTLKGTYRITFLDKKEAVKKYGEKGKYGVIIAETIR